MPPFRPFALPGGVTPMVGEGLRFLVQSRTDRKQKYLVDLEECGFNGACGCPDFQLRHLPELRRDRDRGVQRKRRCWHIGRALYYWAEISARAVARKGGPL